MPTYHLWVKQYCEGCDYTIGCAERLIPLPLSTLDDPAAAVLEALEHYGIHPGGERAAEKLLIVKTVDELDPDDWDFREPEDDDDESPEKAARRRLYEELKREFG